MPDDLLNMRDDFLINIQRMQKIARGTRPNFFITIMKFAIGYIMQQGRKFNGKYITIFSCADMFSVGMYAVNVPPIVPALGILEGDTYKICGFINYVGMLHCSIISAKILLLAHFGHVMYPLGFGIDQFSYFEA